MSNSPFWKYRYGLTGYLLLGISTAFIDVDMIALLAIPLFILSQGLLLKSYSGLIESKNPNRLFAILLFVCGILLLSFLAIYTSANLNDLLRNDSHVNALELKQAYSSLTIRIIAFNIGASVMIMIGLKISGKLTNRDLLFNLIPTLLVIPIVILLITKFELHRIGI